MAFPFAYTGEISCLSLLPANVESFQKDFMQNVRRKLDSVHSLITVRDNEISFSPNVKLRFFFIFFDRTTALLSRVPNGKFILKPEAGVIVYYMDFKQTIIVWSIAVLGVFGTVFMLGMPWHFLLKLAIIFCVWVTMIVFSYLASVEAMRNFINQILNEMNVDPI